MSRLAENLAEAWKERANREAVITEMRGRALTKPSEYERSLVDFHRAVDWYRYWTGIGAQ